MVTRMLRTVAGTGQTGPSEFFAPLVPFKTPYAIGFVVALFLHLLLPEDKEKEEEEDSGKEMKVDPVLSTVEA